MAGTVRFRRGGAVRARPLLHRRQRAGVCRHREGPGSPGRPRVSRRRCGRGDAAQELHRARRLGPRRSFPGARRPGVRQPARVPVDAQHAHRGNGAHCRAHPHLCRVDGGEPGPDRVLLRRSAAAAGVLCAAAGHRTGRPARPPSHRRRRGGAADPQSDAQGSRPQPHRLRPRVGRRPGSRHPHRDARGHARPRDAAAAPQQRPAARARLPRRGRELPLRVVHGDLRRAAAGALHADLRRRARALSPN